MSDNKKSILTRVYLVYAMVCLFGLAIVARIWHIQVVEGEYWRAKADSLTIKTMKIEPARGNIFSTDGSLLATSVPIYDLRVDFKVDGLTDTEFNSKIDSLALSLSWLFRDKPSREYKRLLVQARREGKRYFLLKKNVSHKDMLTVKKFPPTLLLEGVPESVPFAPTVSHAGPLTLANVMVSPLGSAASVLIAEA